jgi:exosortase
MSPPGEVALVQPLRHMSDTKRKRMLRRWLFFTGWVTLCSLLFFRPLIRLLHLSMVQDDMSYLTLIPILVACLLFVERHSIFRNISSDITLGFLLVVFGIGLVTSIHTLGRSLPSDLQLSLNILALLLFLIAGFAISFGRSVVQAGYFPLLYLFLMIPLPDFLLHRVIYLLQAGSADITGALFDLLRVPALRQGFVFHLPQVSIAVEKECSGIRSSMALLILALPILHFRIRRAWKKAVFLVCAMLVMIVKNGIRIVTLTLLAMYVDPSFLFGRLHRQGGVVFFLLGLLLLVPIYLALQVGESATRQDTSRTENNSQARDASQPGEIGQA